MEGEDEGDLQAAGVAVGVREHAADGRVPVGVVPLVRALPGGQDHGAVPGVGRGVRQRVLLQGREGVGGGAGGEKVQPDAIEEAEEEGEDGESVMESEGEGEWENEDGREEFDEVDLEGGREGASGREGKRRGSSDMRELNLNAPSAAVMQK